MENEQIKKEYSLQETPWYFGAYLNMARHNAYLISNEINTKFNLGRSIGNEEDIAQSFLTDKNLIEKNNANLIYSNFLFSSLQHLKNFWR